MHTVVQPPYMDHRSEPAKLDAFLSLDVVRAVEAAAIAAARWVGRGDEQAADSAAAQAMRQALRDVAIQGKVVVGDGPRGAVPALYVGEAVGAGGTSADVIVDALECISRAARTGPDAISVIAVPGPGGFLPVPPIHMHKIAVDPAAVNANLSIGADAGETVRVVAAAMGSKTSNVTACVLDRPRHAALIQAVRDTGARVRIIGDGDIVGALLPSLHDSGVDLYLGTGGAQEGVLAVAALRGLGGRIVARLAPSSDDDRAQIAAAGIPDADRDYGTEDLAHGEVIFAAVGVTPGALLDGAIVGAHDATTHAVVIRSRTGSVRWIKTHHRLDEHGNLRSGN
jgi:fructose-1,6-bisphosphatase II / sedoheptulose-1,7-bisphosphatase